MNILKQLKQFAVTMICITSVFACKTNKESNLEFTPITVADSIQNYSNDTAISNIISINYFDAKITKNGDSVACNINNDFFAWLEPFFDNGGNQVTKDNLKDVVASEIKRFIKDINEDKSLADCESCKHAELFIDTLPIYQNDKIVSLVYTFNQYSGGAHSTYGLTAFNYKKDGTPVTTENLSKNINELSEIAQKAFIQQNGELKDYWFDDNKFYLPEVFYFTEKSVIFYYSLYEIAAYSAGDIYIELNNDDVKHLIEYIN
ncbi:MAG: DUF3298 and DUF4163 domain-containing protein [Prevotellaceae bacterium]|jgi:hypothetical protein|nr:DUF3298 and DUF4163 domain-containing protein [Prevotellaceae bacterium]